jgi:hypothetical protein
VAVSVPLKGGITDKVIVPVAEIVGVLVDVRVAVAVEVEGEAAVGVNVNVYVGVYVGVEADFTESVLACSATPTNMPRNNKIGTVIITRARRRRSGCGATVGIATATATALRSVVRVASTR